MIDMLKRPEGATVEQIAAATGWQHHTIRGAISGALKKKLGLTVEATRTREVGPNKTGAKGSSTVYRITGSRRRPAEARSATCTACSSDRAIGSTRRDSPEAGGPARRAGPQPRRPRPGSRRARAHRGHHGPHHRRDQRGRRVRHQPRGLAPGPARRLPRALHPAPLAQGPRAARPRARGQHRARSRGRCSAEPIGPTLHPMASRPRAQRRSLRSGGRSRRSAYWQIGKFDS